MAVTKPVKLTIKTTQQDKPEMVTAKNNPEDEKAGQREIPFSGDLYIEQEDFREEANRKFFRLSLGQRSSLEECLYNKR